MKEELPYIDAVRALPEPTFIVSSEGRLLDANLAGYRVVGVRAGTANLELTSLIESSEGELAAHLRLWAQSRSSLPGTLVWRTVQGPRAYRVNGWCARPASDSRPALVVIRCELDGGLAQRFIAINQQLDLIRAELQVRRQGQLDLAEALKVRDDFVAIAAHELRNPLNVFHLTLQLLYRVSNQPKQDTRALVGKLGVQLERLSSLVDRLLDVTKIRAGRFELEPQPFDLAPLVQEVAARFSALSPETPLLVQIEATAIGYWDRLRIDQALSNLLANALKYGLHKPVSVTVSVASQDAFITVRDQGVGLDAGDLQRIFKRFERAMPQSNREGLGLGLWITKCIVEAHNGSIWAEGSPGNGAVFTIRLPLPEVET